MYDRAVHIIKIKYTPNRVEYKADYCDDEGYQQDAFICDERLKAIPLPITNDQWDVITKDIQQKMALICQYKNQIASTTAYIKKQHKNLRSLATKGVYL
jgi:hypothetical protein